MVWNSPTRSAKIEDIQLVNVLLVSKYFNNLLPSISNNGLILFSDIHNYNTATPFKDKLLKLSFRSNLYGKNIITISAFTAWKKIQTAFKYDILKNLTTIQVKTY